MIVLQRLRQTHRQKETAEAEEVLKVVLKQLKGVFCSCDTLTQSPGVKLLTAILRLLVSRTLFYVFQWKQPELLKYI